MEQNCQHDFAKVSPDSTVQSLAVKVMLRSRSKSGARNSRIFLLRWSSRNGKKAWKIDIFYPLHCEVIFFQLFLDDARMKNFTSCYKEVQFLKFFFTRLKKNDTRRYQDFPYLSLCGKERNYVRCDDLPIVFTHVLDRYFFLKIFFGCQRTKLKVDVFGWNSDYFWLKVASFEGQNTLSDAH